MSALLVDQSTTRLGLRSSVPQAFRSSRVRTLESPSVLLLRREGQSVKRCFAQQLLVPARGLGVS
jgi:hypothetical protein